MIDIRQSPKYARFMIDLGWEVEKVGKWRAFVRKFPVIGSFAKIQKIKPPIPFDGFEKLERKYKVLKFQIAPDILAPNTKVVQHFTDHQFYTDHSPNIPTQTIQIDLSKSEKMLFNNLTSTKRRAVRRAIKNGVVVKESSDMGSFINIRKKQNSPLGFLLVKEMESLWRNFYPENASLILAHSQQRPIAGILLLFYERVAYYWYASSLEIGKKLFAPSLIVWEALKVSKKRGAKIFDFEGIYDERFDKATESWQGFSKFKEGFGGQRITYIGSFKKIIFSPFTF